MAFRSARSARSAPRDFASELKVAEESKDWLACLRITQDAVKYEADLALAAAKTLSAPKPKMSTAEASLHRQGSAIHEADEALAALSFLKPTSKLPVAEANFVRHVEEAGQRLGSNAAKLQHVRAYRQRSASIQCSANEASPASVFRMVKNIWAESSCTCFDEEEVMAPRPEQPDRHFRSPPAGSKVCLAGAHTRSRANILAGRSSVTAAISHDCQIEWWPRSCYFGGEEPDVGGGARPLLGEAECGAATWPPVSCRGKTKGLILSLLPPN